MADSDDSNRRSIRLGGYDYSQGGCYYVTVCTQDRVHRFGEVVGATVILNEVGRMLVAVWESLPVRFPTLALDAFVVMPDHVHGVLWIRPPGVAGGRVVAASLGAVVGAFKSLVTTAYISGVRAGRWTPFDGKLLQRNYHDHVVRSDESLESIREYIRTNPARWGRKAEA